MPYGVSRVLLRRRPSCRRPRSYTYSWPNSWGSNRETGVPRAPLASEPSERRAEQCKRHGQAARAPDRAASGARRRRSPAPPGGSRHRRGASVKLYDAARCPFCARVRIALAEKGLDYERVEIDLGNRPAWLYDLNPLGKVPVLDDGFVLPESAVIMEYLEDEYPANPLLPREPKARAVTRKSIFRFDDLLGDDYYAFRRGQ